LNKKLTKKHLFDKIIYVFGAVFGFDENIWV